MNNYFAPSDLAELSAALKIKDEQTFIAAGCTDLMIHFNEKGIFERNIIDITKIAALKQINEDEHSIKVGAAITMTELHNNSLIRSYVPGLAQAAYNVGSEQIRNLATLGGNIANASQSADSLPVLFAYNAELEIIDSKQQISHRPIAEIVAGLGKNNLAQDQAIIAIIIPKSKDLSGYAKAGARQTVTISKVGCALKLSLKDDIIAKASIYLGAVGACPKQADLIENSLLNCDINQIEISEIKDIIRRQILELIPNRSSRFYKKEAAIGVIADALANCRKGAN